MFKRVTQNLEQWNELIPYVAFAFTAICFIIAVVWAIRLKKPDSERLSRIPFKDDEDT
jgi:hypothetical protein